MVKFLIGVIFGATLTIWYTAFDLNYDLDSNIFVNAVIASASAVAAAIHFDAVRKQRKDHVWEINKGHLLGLLESLSEVIELTSELLDFEFEVQQGITNSTNRPVDTTDRYKKLTKHLKDSLNVYSPLLSDDVLKAIEQYKKANKAVDEAFEQDYITSLFEVYDNIYANQKELHKAISKHVKELAGVKFT
ncbi:hypothetical protein V6957_004944 [Vibrio parahaemolyticus]|uniref:hypothetical protein n=1 Tax=Vibrio parahaemolyticus TaxID=670 RepID=UPI00084B32BD|nr:hypothetical protein [Vibrio parahaemolyticus]EGQ8957247.1 hypothetical protein [Vibrio parahaemolyticus]EGQ8991577.1 hypothetical protein [Vibrio parahaemolyticus]EGQ9010838.1 hypothetical protein [Vibrio parahaemolyticus]EGR2870537.1 hypothetical protein [Vibrio parahaemolyticus]EGR2899910.1 hypothetical protein [Vibrio parahaemolyticus]